ncbi:MAG: nucleotidyltransferase domain-containing protein [Bacillota bacterium]|nr:nucleotidyltransferase domain-containing protein [Bacillota bacterium]
MNQEMISKIKEYLKGKDYIIFAYIFGSAVNSKETKYSDVDLAVYTTKSEIETTEYLGMKRELMDMTSKEIDIVILNNASPLVKKEVFNTGVKLFSKDEEVESNFIVHTYFEYEDMKKYYDMSFKAMVEEVKDEVNKYGKE